MVTLEYARLRLALNRARPFRSGGPQEFSDIFTGERPVIAFGRALQIEVGLFNGGVGGVDGVLDYSGLTSITAQLRVAVNNVIDIAGGDVFNRSTGAFFALGQDEWDNDSGNPSYHAVIRFTAAEMGALAGLAFGSDNTAPAGLVFSGTTPQGLVPLGAGLVRVFKDGGTGPGSGVAPVAAYTFTDEQLQAMLSSKLNAGENDRGISFTLRGANGKGINLWVDDSIDPPILRQTQLPA
jgi:hypothetical protein